MHRHIILFLVLLAAVTQAHAGRKLKVLFIGNSYTYVNSMPAIVADIAANRGDTLIWDMAAPGGADLVTHSYDPATLAKIKLGNWDYVVLQEQSLVPSMPEALGDMTFMHARLDSIINLYNPCAETMYYMTWGRKNGEADYCKLYSGSPYYWPHHCTYAAMDSVIRLRYCRWADSMYAVLAPVGAVWHYTRSHFPAIELYDADGSHPSPAGSYAAACCFYTALFRKDPVLIGYNYTLSAGDAAAIRTAVKEVTYDSMRHWHLGQYRTEARFTYTLSASTAAFTGTADNAAAGTWYFGDGATTTTPNPIHTYASPGTYLVTQVVQNSSGTCMDTAYALLDVGTSGVPNAAGIVLGLSPNPVTNFLNIDAAVFLSGTYTIHLCNELGQTMLTQSSLPALRQSIDLSACHRGLYLLTISKGGQTLYRGKVLKQ